MAVFTVDPSTVGAWLRCHRGADLDNSFSLPFYFVLNERLELETGSRVQLVPRSLIHKSILADLTDLPGEHHKLGVHNCLRNPMVLVGQELSLLTGHRS